MKVIMRIYLVLAQNVVVNLQVVPAKTEMRNLLVLAQNVVVVIIKKNLHEIRRNYALEANVNPRREL
jgi:hypothetical protein